MRSSGFLPQGLYQHILAAVITLNQDVQSQETIRSDFDHNENFFDTLAVASYRDQVFRLQFLSMENCIRVDVKGMSPIAIFEWLSGLIDGVISKTTRFLNYSIWVPYISDSNDSRSMNIESVKTFVSLLRMRSTVVQTNGTLQSRHFELTSREILTNYGCWIKSVARVGRVIDVFMSYRWTDRQRKFTDSEFIGRLVDELWSYTITRKHRSMLVFRDTDVLEQGRNFKDDFCKALIDTRLMVPLVSGSLVRMKSIDEDTDVDNTLLEWVIMLVCFELQGKVPALPHERRLFPVLLGAWDSATSTRDVLTVEAMSFPGVLLQKKIFINRAYPLSHALLHTSNTINVDIRPVKTLIAARDQLNRHGVTDLSLLSVPVEQYTMRGIITKLLEFNYYKNRSKKTEKQISSEVCEEITKILNSFVDQEEPNLSSNLEPPIAQDGSGGSPVTTTIEALTIQL